MTTSHSHGRIHNSQANEVSVAEGRDLMAISHSHGRIHDSTEPSDTAELSSMSSMSLTESMPTPSLPKRSLHTSEKWARWPTSRAPAVECYDSEEFSSTSVREEQELSVNQVHCHSIKDTRKLQRAAVEEECRIRTEKFRSEHPTNNVSSITQPFGMPLVSYSNI